MAEIAHIWRSPKRRELMEELDTAQVFENEGVEPGELRLAYPY